MQVNLLHSYGKRDIKEYEMELPEMSDDQIEIQTIFCGVCRSDIGAYMGWEHPMPLGQFGHEGLGKVVEKGKNVTGVEIGDIVATWSDPAYSDYYYAKQNEFVVIPEATPRYILQPAACAINIATKTLHWMKLMNLYHDVAVSVNTTRRQFDDILLLGSGFMSIVIGQYFKHLQVKVDVVGSSNSDLWNDISILKSLDTILESGKQYSAVIDLTSKGTNFPIITKLTKPEGLICYAATPYDPVTTNFFENCWNCHTFIMPSPRNSDFNTMMALTRDLITNSIINTDFIWTKGYNRWDDDEVFEAFEDGANRTPEYVRGYLKF